MTFKKTVYLGWHDVIVKATDIQASDESGLHLVPDVIPALRGLVLSGYQLKVLLPLTPEAGPENSPEILRVAPSTVRQFLLVQRLLRSQGVVIDPLYAVDGSDPLVGASSLSPLMSVMIEQRTKILASPVSESLLRQCVTVGEDEYIRVFGHGVGLRLWALSGSTWMDLVKSLLFVPRSASVCRKTKETKILVSVDLNGSADDSRVTTGIGFFDHMLMNLAKHGGLEIKLSVEGDLEVDEHHTVEDTALALGEALSLALGDRRGISRFGFVLPMDEAKATAAIDLSARPWFNFSGHLAGLYGRTAVGGLPLELVPHFFQSLSQSLGATLHMAVRGENSHHQVESLFKAFARAFGQAAALQRFNLWGDNQQSRGLNDTEWQLLMREMTNEDQLPSTKGTL